MMSRSNRNRTWTMIGTLTLAGVSTFVGCSSDPATSATRPPMGGSGGGAGTGVTAGTGGTGVTAGTGGMAGSTTAGTGGAAGGTGGTAGSGGTGGYMPPTPYCDTQTPKALPIPLDGTWSFPDSDQDSFSEFTFDGECPERAPGSPVGGCKAMTWTPNTRLWVAWHWHNTMGNWTGPGVCVADGAQAVTLQARAADGTEVDVAFATVGEAESAVTLTEEWQTITIDVSNIQYNTVHSGGGVNAGLIVVMDREAGDTAERTIYFDDIQWVGEVGGEGGAGGGGGAGGAPAAAGAGGA